MIYILNESLSGSNLIGFPHEVAFQAVWPWPRPDLVNRKQTYVVVVEVVVTLHIREIFNLVIYRNEFHDFRKMNVSSRLVQRSDGVYCPHLSCTTPQRDSKNPSTPFSFPLVELSLIKESFDLY